jgi:DNA-binding transcriptional LysR family regulator
LEAVDRLGSASAAAQELALTHSAVSRQIKVLEGQIGVRLVYREHGRLCLTAAAHQYCRRVRTVLEDLAQSTLSLRANPSGGNLNLAILPAFGMHWLAPKLKSFAQAHPEITVNLSTRLAPFDFDTNPMDAALHYGERSWRGVDYLELSDERVLPVCAPDYLAKPVAKAADLKSMALLHLETRPDAWKAWFEGHDVSTDDLSGMRFDQFSTMAQAAVHAMGIALLPDYLARTEIERGRLVSAFGDPTPASGNYFLVWPKAEPVKHQVQTFVSWLQTTLEQDGDQPAPAG